MMPTIDGRVAWKFTEKNYDVDNILGVSYITVRDIEVLKKACMKPYEEDFSSQIRSGDLLVANHNFGYGHTHFSPFIAMRALGIKAVLAESFFPDFYKAETTFGFLLLEVPGILDAVKRWDRVRIDWDHEVIVINENQTLPYIRMPQRTKDLVESSGIISYLKNKRNAVHTD